METLISYQQALIYLNEVGRQINRRAETLEIEQALGRTLADDVSASENYPAWNCSAMDGFAADAASLIGSAPQASHAIKGILAAGDPPVHSSSGVWEIMTGAPLPDHCNSVLPIEDCVVDRDSEGKAQSVVFRKALQVGKNIRQAGEDFTTGSRLFLKGQVLDANSILALATLGVAQVRVLAKLRVALISTGKELVSFRSRPEPGQIRNSSGPFLMSLLQTREVEIHSTHSTGDSGAAFRRLIEVLSQDATVDLVLTTGAISMGQFDFVAGTLRDLSARSLFQKVNVRPGKPILLAELKGSDRPLFLLGLPGQPIATAVGIAFFLDPLLGAQRGSAQAEKSIWMPLAEDCKKPAGVVSFVRGGIRTSAADSASVAWIHSNQQPSRIGPLLECQAWIELPEAADFLPAGTAVRVVPF